MNARFLPWLLLAAALEAGAATPCRQETPGAPIPPVSLYEIARGLEQPVHLTHAGDGSGRLFVVEQAGRIRILKDRQLLPRPFLDIRDQVRSGGEKGLLSVAFHPRFRENGLFYVNYTSATGGLHTVVSRFRAPKGAYADRASEKILLTVAQPYGNHNGGQLAFGPDGYLYIGMGDGGSANDPQGHGQNPATLLGSLLRIDVDGRSGLRPYGIPLDNPFVGRPGFRPEIWAFGLRNPWRFSFDALTGELYLGDVGQDEVEEIDLIRRGGNYGWNIMEGDICTPGVETDCDRKGLEPPIHTYRHPKGFSITGGFVYRGRAIRGLCGVYLYADYVTQALWGLRYENGRVTAQRQLLNKKNLLQRILSRFDDGGLNISSFGEDEALELYVTDHTTGRVLKLIPAR